MCVSSGVQTEVEKLKKELAAAKIENEELRLRLDNTVLMLKAEMTASGSLPKLSAPKR